MARATAVLATWCISLASLLSLLSLASCREEKTLVPDRGSRPVRPDLVPCPNEEGPVFVADIGLGYGEIRVMKADDGVVFVAASPDHYAGTLLRAAEGVVTPLAGIGQLPSSIAYSDLDVFTTCSTGGEVYRVSKDGGSRDLVTGELQPRGIIVDYQGTVYWIAGSPQGSIRSLNFGPFPNRNPVVPGPSFGNSGSLAHDGGWLYAAGDHGVQAAHPSFGARSLAGECDGRALILRDDSLLCLSGSRILRAPRDGSNASPIASIEGTVLELVSGGGRTFVLTDSSKGVRVLSYADDLRFGEPPNVVPLPPGARTLTTDRCHLYFSLGTAIHRWAL